MSRIIDLFARFIVDRPRTVSLLLLLWSAFVLVGYTAPHVVHDWVVALTTASQPTSNVEEGHGEPVELPDGVPFSLSGAVGVLVILGVTFFC